MTDELYAPQDEVPAGAVLPPDGVDDASDNDADIEDDDEEKEHPGTGQPMEGISVGLGETGEISQDGDQELPPVEDQQAG